MVPLPLSDPDTESKLLPERESKPVEVISPEVLWLKLFVN